MLQAKIKQENKKSTSMLYDRQFISIRNTLYAIQVSKYGLSRRT